MHYYFATLLRFRFQYAVASLPVLYLYFPESSAGSYCGQPILWLPAEHRIDTYHSYDYSSMLKH